MTPEVKDLTSEQQKQIRKILFNSRLSMSFLAIKFGVGIFLANVISILIGNKMLQGLEPETLAGFQVVSIFTNFIFMAIYLNGQLEVNSAIVAKKVKEVLNNDKQ